MSDEKDTVELLPWESEVLRLAAEQEADAYEKEHKLKKARKTPSVKEFKAVKR